MLCEGGLPFACFESTVPQFKSMAWLLLFVEKGQKPHPPLSPCSTCIVQHSCTPFFLTKSPVCEYFETDCGGHSKFQHSLMNKGAGPWGRVLWPTSSYVTAYHCSVSSTFIYGRTIEGKGDWRQEIPSHGIECVGEVNSFIHSKDHFSVILLPCSQIFSFHFNTSIGICTETNIDLQNSEKF